MLTVLRDPLDRAVSHFYHFGPDVKDFKNRRCVLVVCSMWTDYMRVVVDMCVDLCLRAPACVSSSLTRAHANVCVPTHVQPLHRAQPAAVLERKRGQLHDTPTLRHAALHTGGAARGQNTHTHTSTCTHRETDTSSLHSHKLKIPAQKVNTSVPTPHPHQPTPHTGPWASTWPPHSDTSSKFFPSPNIFKEILRHPGHPCSEHSPLFA